MELDFESHLFQVIIFIFITTKFTSSSLINLYNRLACRHAFCPSYSDKIKYQKAQGVWNGSLYSGLQFEEEGESA